MRPRSLSAVTALLATAVASLAACAPDSSDSLVAAPSTTGRAAPAVTTDATSNGSATPGEPTVAVPESLRFTARGVGGGTIDMAQYAGRPVVLWFWAPG